MIATTGSINATYAPPQLTAITSVNQVNSNEPVSLQLNDFGPDTAALTGWNINWGDGTPVQTRIAPADESSPVDAIWNVSHSYSQIGIYTPAVTATDFVATYTVAVSPSTIIVSNLPPTPTNLTVESISGTENYVTWVDEAGSPAYYTILRSTAGGTPQSIASVVSGTTAYLDSGLSTSTSYTYFVIATNTFGSSDPQPDGVPATTQSFDNTGYYRVTSVGVVTAATTGAAAVIGELSALNSGWVIAGSQMGAMLDLVRGELTVPSNGGIYDSGLSGAFRPTETGLAFDDSYGLGGGNFNYKDDIIPITVEESPVPLNPTNIASTAVGTHEIDITWAPVKGQIDGYNVYRYVSSPDGGGSWQRLNPGSSTTVVGTSTTFRDVGLTPGTAYNYCVTSQYNRVESAMNQVSGGDTNATTLEDRVDTPTIIEAYEYVYNNINVELYAGSLKGAEATDETKSGNDWDQAQLLVEKINSVALNHPATFGYGRIETSYDSVRQWLGLNADLSNTGVFNIIASAGLSPIDVAGSIEFDHAWVDVNLGSAGTIRLDPSWKQTQTVSGVSNAIDAYSSDPVVDPIFLASNDTPYQYYQQQLTNWLATSASGSGIGDVPIRGAILRESFAKLPDAPPYEVVQDAGSFSSVPATYTHRVNVTISQGGNVLFSYAYSLPENPTKTLTFHSDGTYFHLFVDSFDSSGNLNTTDIETPLRTNPNAPVQITVEHFDSGYDMSSPTPDESKYHINEYTRSPTDWSVIAINADQTSTTLLQHVQEEITSIDSYGNENSDLSDDKEVLAARLTLLLEGLTYFSDLNTQRDQLADELHVMPVISHAESAVVTGTGTVNGTEGIDEKWGQNIPFPVQLERTHIDAGNVGLGSRLYEPTDPLVSPSNLASIASLIEANGSALESSSLEEVTSSEAMSTIKGFEWAQKASDSGPTVWAPNQAVPAVVATLPMSIQTELKNENSDGNTLILPSEAIIIATSTPNDPKWSGFVWIIQSPSEYDFDGQPVRRFALMRDTDPAPELGGDTYDPSSDDSTNAPTPVSPWGDSSTGFDAATGESTRDETDVTVPNVLPVAFTRHYDSFTIPELTDNPQSTQTENDAANHLVDEGLGLGWTYAYGDFLYFDGSSGAATLCSSDGTRRTFAKNPAVESEFVSPGGDYGSLSQSTRGQDILYSYSSADGKVFTFLRPADSNIAKLQSETDSNSNTVVCNYDSHGYLRTVSDGAGHTLFAFTWYPDGVLGDNVEPHIETVQAGGQTWTYSYVLIDDGLDTGQRVALSEVTSPIVTTDLPGGAAASSVSYQYFGEDQGGSPDASHLALWGLLQTVTQPNRGTRTYSYYANRQVSTVIDSKGFEDEGVSADGISSTGRSEVTSTTLQSASYDVLSRTTKVIDADGNATLTTFTSDGHPDLTQMPDGSVETQAWAGIDDVGVYRGNSFMVDQDASQTSFSPEKGRKFNFGLAGDDPVVGDWNGLGHSEIGVYRNGIFYLDYSGDGVYEPGIDLAVPFGGGETEVPIIGDWNGDGIDDLGVFDTSTGTFFEKLNGFLQDSSQMFQISTPYAYARPVIGDWDGIGRSELGVMTIENSMDVFHLFNAENSPAGPGYQFGPATGHDLPVSGYFSPGNVTDFGVFRQQSDGSYQFVLDSNGNRMLDSEQGDGTTFTPQADARISMGESGDMPIIGNWSGDGTRNLLLLSQDAIGRTTRSVYNAEGNVISQVGPDGLETVTSYTDLYTDPSTGLGIWEKPFQVTIVGREGLSSRITTYLYQPGQTGNLLWSDDPDGDVTLMSYDAYGRLSTITKPNGVDASTNPGDPIQAAGGAAYTTTYVYASGASGQQTGLVATQTIGSDSQINSYDPFGNLTSSSDGAVSSNGVTRITITTTTPSVNC